MKKFLRDESLKGKWDFDFRLGYKLSEAEKLLPLTEQKMIESLRERRIDAICETEDTIWILEVKDKLRPSGLGQLTTYEHLYKTKFRPIKKIRLGYIAAIDDPTMHDVLHAKGVTFWIVPVL
uniref:Uncharacterized protein n=1 Tax=viral metagenome TaxID=1070528 RepID=A0A6H1ZZ12_9ZZZZ